MLKNGSEGRNAAFFNALYEKVSELSFDKFLDILCLSFKFINYCESPLGSSQMITITTVIYFIYKWLIWFQFNKGLTRLIHENLRSRKLQNHSMFIVQFGMSRNSAKYLWEYSVYF